MILKLIAKTLDGTAHTFQIRAPSFGHFFRTAQNIDHCVIVQSGRAGDVAIPYHAIAWIGVAEMQLEPGEAQQQPSDPIEAQRQVLAAGYIRPIGEA